MKIILCIYLIVGLIVIWKTYKAWWNEKHPPLCVDCSNLEFINKPHGYFKYYCKYRNFDNPPEYCHQYSPREDEENES